MGTGGRGKYRIRTWLRRQLPGPISARIPKGKTDCGHHDWYNHDDVVDHCYHCEVGIRPRLGTGGLSALARGFAARVPPLGTDLPADRRGLTTDIARQGGLRVRAIGGLDLVAAVEALAFLEECERAGVRVLGIEGFRMGSGDSVHPVMDAMVDLSEVATPTTSVREARKFVSTLADSRLWFDFTVAD